MGKDTVNHLRRSCLCVFGAMIVSLSLGGCQAEQTATSARVLKLTDHGALLAAGREILNRTGSFRPHPKLKASDDTTRQSMPDPRDRKMPALILRLKPDSIHVFQDSVLLRWKFSCSELAVRVYREGVDEEAAERGGVQGLAGPGTRLIPGLWYREYRRGGTWCSSTPVALLYRAHA
jgi:hypothetical protein